MLSERQAVSATVVLILLASSAAAHHILGLPHYSYKENYPQVPVLEYPATTGPYEVLLVCYPGKPNPGEPANLVFDIKKAVVEVMKQAMLKGYTVPGATESHYRPLVLKAVQKELAANKRAYEAGIESIVEANCLSCHDGSNPHLSNLDGYENIAITVEQDTGADLNTLVRVSHIHLFGLTFIFFIVAFIFSHAYMRPLWLKHVIIIAPFAGVIVDGVHAAFQLLFLAEEQLANPYRFRLTQFHRSTCNRLIGTDRCSGLPI